MLVTAHPPAERSNMVPSRISVLLVLEKKICMSTGMRGYSRHSIIQSPIRFEVSRFTDTTCSRQLGAAVFCHITMRELSYLKSSRDAGSVKGFQQVEKRGKF